jgi:hypothetical protein
MNEDRDLFAFPSPASSTGSTDISVLYLNDVLLVIRDAQTEQKLNTDKIIRAIVYVVMLMCTVIHPHILMSLLTLASKDNNPLKIQKI